MTSSSVMRGWIAGAVALAVDAAFLGLGVAYEKWRDEGKDEVGLKRSSRNGRFYSIEGSTARLIFRFIVVLLVHGGAYVLGGYAQSSTTDDVPTMFWPWFVTYFGVLFFALGGLYLIITVFFKWQDYYFGAGLPPASDAEAGTPLMAANAAARKSPPATLSTAEPRVVGSTPVALRTRRRTVEEKAKTTVAKKRYDFD